MGLSSDKVTSNQAGTEIAKRFSDTFHSIETVVKNIPKNYDKNIVFIELSVLAYLGYRLAIQFAGLTHNTMDQVITVLDHCAREETELGGCEDLLNRREDRYLALTNQHYNSIRQGETKQFALALALNFDQFCRGAGEDGDPAILGDFFEMMPLGTLANRLWMDCFWKTWKYLSDNLQALR